MKREKGTSTEKLQHNLKRKLFWVFSFFLLLALQCSSRFEHPLIWSLKSGWHFNCRNWGTVICLEITAWYPVWLYSLFKNPLYYLKWTWYSLVSSSILLTPPHKIFIHVGLSVLVWMVFAKQQECILEWMNWMWNCLPCPKMGRFGKLLEILIDLKQIISQKCIHLS